MSLSSSIRKQLLESFRAELAEHIQTMTSGLLAIEQGQVPDNERQELLENIFRAAHSLKGAARSLGVTAVEQVSHAMEEVLDGLRKNTIKTSPEMFTACYQALDAIKATQAMYEAGENTPPAEALQSLLELAKFKPKPAPPSTQPGAQTAAKTEGAPAVKPVEAKTNEPPARAVKEAETATAPATASPAGAAREDGYTHTLPARDSNLPAVSMDTDTIRVRIERMDALMTRLSELFIARLRSEQRLVEVRRTRDNLARWQEEWEEVRSAASRLARKREPGNGAGKSDLAVLLDYTTDVNERLRLFNRETDEFEVQLASDTFQLKAALDDMEDEIKRLRMMPLNTILEPMPRMVRDLANEFGKQSVLYIIGGETELDRRVLEQIKDPLIHMLRNAVDHGIEPIEKRQAAGKPPAGSITISAQQAGKEVIITVSDDGAGINLTAVRQAVLERQGAVFSSLSNADLVESIFQAGVTTKQVVTGISGRGIGLDVVRRNVEALQGSVTVGWVEGKGTTFRLILPLRLASSRGLLVRSSGQLFAVPVTALERLLLINEREILLVEGRTAIRYQEIPITLVRLDDTLGMPRLPRANADDPLPVVVLAAGERRIAMMVDELAGEQEIVSQELSKPFDHLQGIAGATLMGNGEIALVLNPADLLRLASGPQPRLMVEETTGEAMEVAHALLDAGVAEPVTSLFRKRILVVDDSITTRTLEKNILEAAGYNVQVATDGQEVLATIAATGVPDLIISDIMMPRMTGFELARHLKNDPKLSSVPIILVSSLDSPEDKAQGIESGADAFIVKGQFDQDNLLDTIQQLI